MPSENIVAVLEGLMAEIAEAAKQNEDQDITPPEKLFTYVDGYDDAVADVMTMVQGARDAQLRRLHGGTTAVDL
jgi:hypothetical protein